MFKIVVETFCGFLTVISSLSHLFYIQSLFFFLNSIRDTSFSKCEFNRIGIVMNKKRMPIFLKQIE